MPLLLFAAPAPAQPTWPALGGSAAHESRSTLATVPSLAAPAWNRSTDDQGRVITWNTASGVVATRDAVLALGSIVNGTTQHRLWCLDRFDGSVRWSIGVDVPNLSSWSTPTVDERRNTVLVAAGSTLTAYALASGVQQWRTTLQAPIVNASPIVTTDLGLVDRAFITDYDGFGAGARLYCINVAPTNASNPFAPGAIVWSVMIGAASGNTAAARDGRVYVSSVGDWGFAPGQILCFDARATPTPGNTPSPLWTFDNPSGESFFGGVCATADDAAGGSAHGGALFAASYAFYGSTLSANLIKLDAGSGAIKWSTPCNRTASIPVPLSGSRIALSGGLQGYGTVPTLQLFADNGTSATLLWDSSLATWTDTNNNGSRDVGEFTPFGGWHNQPVALSDGTRLALGTIASGGDVSGYSTLSIVNTSVAPSSASFVVAQRSGVGASPAAAGGNLYSLGASGLMAFGPPPPRCDVNADGRVDIEDLYAWEQGSGTRDVNRDGSVSSADRDALVAELRRDERRDMEGTRR